jgi:hypothetical protein
MSDTQRSERLRTPEGRAAYVNVFFPRPSKRPGGKPRYEMVLIIPKSVEINYLKAEAIKVGQAKFGAKFVDDVKAKKLHWPFRDGDIDRSDKPEFKGCWFINLKANSQPGVVGRRREQLSTPEEFGSGDYCIAMVNFYAFANESKGIAAGVIGIQRTKKGEPLDNRVDAASLFDEIEGDDEDETAAADAGGFGI